MRKRTFAWILLAGGLLMQPAFADPGDRLQQRREQREQRREQQPGRSGPSDAARRAQELNGGGRVLGVTPSDQGYRVKLLKQGEVRVLTVPTQ